MVIRDRIKLLVTAFALLWLALIVAPPVAAADELIEVGHPDIDFLYASIDHGNDYQNVVLEPVSVWYPTEISEASAAADALRRAAIGTFADAATEHGLDLHMGPAADALVARIQYIDLSTAAESDDVPDWARKFQFRVKPGCVTIVAEFRDAETGRVLMRFANLQEAETAHADLTTILGIALDGEGSKVLASN